jgi:hypothetical protein
MIYFDRKDCYSYHSTISILGWTGVGVGAHRAERLEVLANMGVLVRVLHRKIMYYLLEVI